MKKLLPFIIAFIAVRANAQIDSCNAFLQGNYVEVGISPVGSYGSSVAQPAGYHGNSVSGSDYNPCGGAPSGNRLGFIADPAMDGWSVGAPAFIGDYFLPGSPFEGWELQIGSGRVQAFNTNAAGFVGSLSGVSSGSNISYAATGGVVTSTWQGMIDSVGVTQVTTLDTGALFFTMQVTLTNYSSTPINDIYYLRSLDPDNEELYTGDFATANKIVSQGPDSAAIVTADGDSLGAISLLALGTTDTNARSLIYTNWPIDSSEDLATIYSGTSTGIGTIEETAGADLDGDFAIGLAYHIAHLASVDSAADSVGRTTAAAALHPANSTTLKFFYAFSQHGLDSAKSANQSASVDTTTTGGGLTVKNVNATNIRVYPVPAANIINVSGLTSGDALSVVDMMGKETTLAGAASGNTVDQYSLSSFTTGSYILVVKDSNGNVKSRVSIQKK